VKRNHNTYAYLIFREYTFRPFRLVPKKRQKKEGKKHAGRLPGRNSRSRRRTKRVRSARLAFPAVGKNGKSIIAIALTDSRAHEDRAPPFAPPLASPSPSRYAPSRRRRRRSLHLSPAAYTRLPPTCARGSKYGGAADVGDAQCCQFADSAAIDGRPPL